jgi:thiosulfate/3-mercaptopyruvate sulfurtransferase
VRYRFVDCRWELGNPAGGRDLYLDGHIPGASFLDVERDLSAPPASPGGRHPLPSPDDFGRAAGAAGIGPGVLVVAYDQGMNGGAARLWWLLRHFGHDDVAVLDGGIDAWLGPLRGGEEEVEPAVFVPRPRAGDTIDADELAARLDDGRLTVVDARLPERYRGEVEPIDPVAGRIPGALNAPYPDALPDGLAGAEEIAAYCGSGVTACVTLLCLARAGRDDARLYAGSWSDWCARGLPAETG